MSKIALVDDDRNILTSVSMTLEAEGFEVETYNDGQQALDAFSKKLPDLAVLDIKMPRMDGMDLLQRLRQKTQMPVIFLTSKDDEIDEVLGLRMGADDYVRKPFSQRLLVERIRTLLRRQDALEGIVTPADAEEGGEIAGADVDRTGYCAVLPSKEAMKDVIGEKDDTGQEQTEEGTGETTGRRPEQPAEDCCVVVHQVFTAQRTPTTIPQQ